MRARERKSRGSAPDAMQAKELLEKIGDLRFGGLANYLIRTEAVHLISGEAQFSVGRHHVCESERNIDPVDTKLIKHLGWPIGARTPRRFTS